MQTRKPIRIPHRDQSAAPGGLQGVVDLVIGRLFALQLAAVLTSIVGYGLSMM